MTERKLDYTRYYSNFHQETPEYRKGQIGFYSDLLKPYLPADRRARVVDIGCGMGFVISTLHSLGFTNVGGIDVDEGQVAACMRAGLDVTQVVDSTAYLAERKHAFDLILLMDVLEHVPVPNQIDLLAALCDALVPGGKLVLTVPNANSTLAGRWRYGDWTHHSSFTELSLDFVLFNAGFRDIDITTMEFMRSPGQGWYPNVARRQWWRFKLFRWVRYQQLVAELGKAQADKIPLSLNLLATAIRPK